MYEDHGDLCVTFLTGSEERGVAIGVLEVPLCSMLYTYTYIQVEKQVNIMHSVIYTVHM